MTRLFRFRRISALLGTVAVSGGLVLATGLWASAEEPRLASAEPLDRLEAILQDDSVPEAERIARALDAIREARDSRASAANQLASPLPRPHHGRLVPAPGLQLFDDDSLFDDFFADDPPALIRRHYNAFEEMQRMREETDRLFRDAFERMGSFDTGPGRVSPPMGYAPSLDLSEESDRYVIRADLPGVEEGAINVQVDGRRLTLSGERVKTVEQRDPDGRVLRQERQTGRFQRSMTLPGAVDPAGVTQRYEDGVLILELPKAEGDGADGGRLVL